MKLSAAKRNITPQKSVPLGANGDLKNSTFDDIDSTIELNAMRLVADNKQIFLISIDVLFVSDEIKAFILDFLSNRYQLSEDQLFVTATHTHYAPMVDRSKPNLGHVDDNYMEWFLEELKVLLEDLMTITPKPIIIKYSETEAVDLSISRRKKAWGISNKMIPFYKMKLYPNEKSEIDKRIHLMHFYTLDESELIATCWSFACHPVMYHSRKNVTSHFPGAIRNSFRKLLNNDYPVLFFQGFSGDIRPQNFNQSDTIKNKIIKKLNGGYGFTDFTNQTYTIWVENLKKVLLKSFENSQIILKDLNLNIEFEKIKLSQIFETNKDQDITIHSISFAENFIMVAVSAEVVSKYSIMLKQLFPNKIIIPIGCYGQVFGYWPTKKMVIEKGYESYGFFQNFSLKGKFKSNLEKILMDYLKKIVESNIIVNRKKIH